ncbi:tail assembly chaperone [Mycobacterium phage Twister]|uniref:Tail assembly chaperone n=2 Tax=Fromanvirus twister TaxID=1993863 RepID=H9NCK1_9CAUD|nr:tail assembly chaperone [Mycobacterium phage Twister]AFF28322.1 tail assembly chaperone [Mycobacterium phage Twister]QGJ94702.1 tail assembly chaperone [Mycobacterium phage WalterMcMickey]
MSNVFTLDSLREEADKTFAPVKVELSDGTQVTLRNILRLAKNDRKKVLATLETLRSDEEREGKTLDEIDTMVDAVTEVLKVVAGKDAAKLVKELDGDLGMLMGVLNHWLEETAPGGSAELASLIDRYGEALVPDLKHYYGIDLRDLFSEDHPLSPRWVLLHIKNLPMDSAFVAEFRGGQRYRGWDPSRYMQAAVIDLLRVQNYMFVLANSDPKKGKPKEPEPYPLPDYQQTEQKKTYKPGSFGGIVAQMITAKRRKKEAAWQVQQAGLVSRSDGSPSESSPTSTGSTGP